MMLADLIQLSFFLFCKLTKIFIVGIQVKVESIKECNSRDSSVCLKGYRLAWYTTSLASEGFVSGIHDRLMPGRSASSDAHHGRSEDGKRKFVPSQPMTNLFCRRAYMPDTCRRFVHLYPCLQLWTKCFVSRTHWLYTVLFSSSCFLYTAESSRSVVRSIEVEYPYIKGSVLWTLQNCLTWYIMSCNHICICWGQVRSFSWERLKVGFSCQIGARFCQKGGCHIPDFIVQDHREPLMWQIMA